MGIKILPYIDNTKTTSKKTNQNKAKDSSFEETLKLQKESETKAAAAIAIDTLISASKSGSINASIVQDFFDKNNINIKIVCNDAPTATCVNTQNNTTASTSNSSGSINTTTNTNLNSSTRSNAYNALTDVNNATSNNSTSSSSLGCPSSLDDIFEEAAKNYNVDCKLLKAIAKAESGYNTNAVSSAGAMGVMQLMPATAKSLGVTNPYDARENIMGGAKLIFGFLKQYNNDKTLALAAYNAGPGNVNKYGGVPPFKETQNYVKKVLNFYTS